MPFTPVEENKSSFVLVEQEQSAQNPIDSMQNQIRSRAVNSLMIGPVGATTSGNIEDTMPFATGAIGGVVGSKFGHPSLGLGVGTAIGTGFQGLGQKLKGEDSNVTVEDALAAGALATLGGKIFDVGLKSVGLSTQLIPEKARARFFDKALQAVEVGRKKLVSNWGKSVNSLVEKYPDKRINLQPVVQKVKDHIEGLDKSIIPQIKSAVKNNPILKNVIDNPDDALNLTLKDAQDLKNAITSTTKTIIKRSGKGAVTPSERSLFEILDMFDDKITESFPQMLDVRKAYAVGKQAYDLARPLVEKGTPVEGSIFSRPAGLFGLGGTPFMKSVQGKLAFEKIAGATQAGENMFKASRMAYQLNRAADSIKRMGEIAGGGYAIGKISGLISDEKK